VTMKASTRQVDGITIVDLSGRITLGEGSVVLRDTIRDVVAAGNKRILLNLGDVTYIDSSGIGELVSSFTSVRNQGGELKLLNLTKKVHDLLQITKLYTVFDIKDDEAQAVASLGRVSAFKVFPARVRLNPVASTPRMYPCPASPSSRSIKPPDLPKRYSTRYTKNAETCPTCFARSGIGPKFCALSLHTCEPSWKLPEFRRN
jgi:anti-sigma B factor antagonist